MKKAGELARLSPSAVSVPDVRAALGLVKDLPKAGLPPEEISAVGQQVLRVLLSYQSWYLPAAMREDLPGGPALWSVGLPRPESASGGGQYLALASDNFAFKSLTGGGVRDGASATFVKTTITGVDAIAQNFPFGGESRWAGLVLNAGEPDEFVLEAALVPQLHLWEATLRLEAMLASEIGSEPAGAQWAPASDRLAGLLAQRAKLYFVRMGQDLARDTSGENIITLTGNDAAALCANAYGKEQIRAASPQEMLAMSEGAAGAFGYALTTGPDQAAYACRPGEKHIPRWGFHVVGSDWMAATMQNGIGQGRG